ncbi:MFS transporter [Bailinhaonella thermotolerans]|uniref:MFS transporter n=1 Tax=Bailinhaonella thermotolerans TaxID=1070861 RepID=A0A3A4AWA3_9ACTN|nr:MFS transporter [Bailinhaonella thermotolerans]RJL33153.1 MFS transporter [Bailinhaonella thermotolerans]
MDGEPSVWERLRGAGRAVANGARATGHGLGMAGRSAGRAGRAVGRAARRITHADGAGRTGLAHLIELTAVQSLGDALVTVSLAGTLLFGLPVDEARGPVALYLLLTMIPFAIVAPFVGPALDRLRSGRRFVIAGTLVARGLLCWGMASAVQYEDAITLFPAAFGVLVLSKAYGVSRAAVMPSLLPADIALVTANSRVALASLVAAGVGAPVAAGLSAWIGPEWTLRLAMVVFLAGGFYAVRLPPHVDSPDAPAVEPRGSRKGKWRTLLNVGPVVAESLRANAAIRVYSGFLVFFLIFLVRDKHLPGLDQPVTLGVLVAAAGMGALLGTATGALIRSRTPHVIVLLTLGLAAVATGVAAWFFGLWAAVAVAVVAAFAQALGQLALDAIVQHEIGEEVRSSTFGVSEALLQIAWVFGGLVGLVFSLFAGGTAGLATLASVLGLTLLWLLVQRRRRVRASRPAKPRARPGPGLATMYTDAGPRDPGPKPDLEDETDTVTSTLPDPDVPRDPGPDDEDDDRLDPGSGPLTAPRPLG